jgi:hypothetical protein
VRVSAQIDDRIVSAAGGAVATVGCAVATLVLLRRACRVQAARSALLGRPTAYRLHLHGTGIELASWERNFVGECVVRRPPENAVRMAPDVPPRPGQGGGTVIRDSTFIGAPDAAVRVAAQDEPPSTEDAGAARDLVNRYAGLGPEDEVTDDPGLPDAEDATGRYRLPAVCDDGHQFEATYARLGGRSSITHRTPVRVECPECGGDGEVRAGRYSVVDGVVVREDVAEEE